MGGSSSSDGYQRQQLEKMQSDMAALAKRRAEDKARFEEMIKHQLESQERERRRLEEMYRRQQKLEREKNELEMQLATLASKQDIYKSKQEALTAVKEELSKANEEYKKQEEKLNRILSEINNQSNNISRRWLNSNEISAKNADGGCAGGNGNDDDSKDGSNDNGGNGNADDNDGNDNDDDSKEPFSSESVLARIELLQSKLSKMRVIICIGKTGLGKSTFLNRFVGDTSDDGDQGCNSVLFKVGKNVESETFTVNHNFIRHKHDNRDYCIVDTPGSSDSYGNDNMHTNNIAEYLCGCGGINAFLIFINLADARVDYEYIKLLKLYNNMLSGNDGNGNDNDNSLWWKHVIIIGTNYDTFLFKERNRLKKMNEEDRNDYLKARSNDIINKFRKEKELGIPRNLPMVLVPIGHDNYEEAIEDALSRIQGYKFVCDKIVSPLNQLKNEARNEEDKLNDMKSEVNKINMRKERIEQEMESVSNQIDDISKDIQQRKSKSN